MVASVEGNVIGLATPVNDSFGSKTAAAGTAITRVVPGRAGVRARVVGFSYLPAATAHTLHFLTVMDEALAQSDAAAAQGVVKLSKPLANVDLSALETVDWFCIQHEDGTWGEYNYGSNSGLDLTVSPVLVKKVLKNGRVCYMGKPADHATDRKYTLAASQRTQIGYHEKVGICTATKNGEPILAHVDNITAPGDFTNLAYVFDPNI